MLRDGRVAILDGDGICIFDSQKTNGIRLRKLAKLSKKYKPAVQKRSGGASLFGLFTSRKNGGEVGTYTNDANKGHIFVWLQNTSAKISEWKIREAPIKFRDFEDDYVIGRPNPMIR